MTSFCRSGTGVRERPWELNVRTQVPLIGRAEFIELSNQLFALGLEC